MDSWLIYEKDGRNPQAGVTASVSEPDSDGLIWHPLVFRGGYNHPQAGPFHIGTKETTQILANFEAGIPSQGGIPIDEDGLHQQRAGGAFGWIEKLEKRNGSIWGGIRWAPEGKVAVESGQFKFVSARFEPGHDNRPHPVFGDIGAFVMSGALVTRPFFFKQPELAVAAGLFTHDPEAKDPEQTSGGNSMAGTAMTQEAAREAYVAAHGEQNDEQWTALTAGIEDGGWEAFIEAAAKKADDDNDADELAKLRAEKEALEKKIEEDAAAAKAAADAAGQSAEEREKVAVAASAALRSDLDEARTEITGLATTVEQMRSQRSAAEIRQEVAASAHGGNPLTPAAIEVVANARIDPSKETLDALLAHIDENKGQVGTFIAGEVAASVPPPDGASVEELINSLGFPEAAKANIRNIMTADPKLSLDDATNLHLDAMNAGSI